MWRISWALNNASKWQMGVNSTFKGLKNKILATRTDDCCCTAIISLHDVPVCIKNLNVKCSVSAIISLYFFFVCELCNPGWLINRHYSSRARGHVHKHLILFWSDKTGLYDGSILCPEESYRMCVCVCHWVWSDGIVTLGTYNEYVEEVKLRGKNDKTGNRL
jgi:hypothetical protein